MRAAHFKTVIAPHCDCELFQRLVMRSKKRKNRMLNVGSFCNTLSEHYLNGNTKPSGGVLVSNVPPLVYFLIVFVHTVS